ncbi:MAG: hypothetical protein C4545_01275 [Anaerolineaceae bacterium]|jgi:uncharacterized protein (TIGR03663 family)|nr:MAG: hypothetical protein C4545_01275 [Anaerolineaceae bacterium]
MNNMNTKPEISLKNVFGKFSWFSVLIILIIIAAVLSRFVNLGDRVMSHDEVNHVVPSYDLYTGAGYEHNPVSHGPLQFHLIALSYFLFGDSDFSSRIPHALASVATIVFLLFAFRKYFGKTGATISAILFLISPYLLFYGRYARNEAFVGLFLVVILYAVIRYFDKRDNFSLYLLTATLSLYFTSKETAYIHTAILMIFFFVKMLAEIIHSKIIQFRVFLLSILLIILIGGSLIGSVLIFRQTDLTAIDSNALVLQNTETQTFRLQVYYISESIKVLLPGLIPLLAGILVILFIRKSLRWDLLSASPAFNIFILITTLVLPLLAAFPVRFCGYDPIAYTSATSTLLDFIYILYLASISIILGFTWKRAYWWKAAVLFYFIFFIFYTTFLTNMKGALTGTVGSLGYWLSQQDVNRGNQPIYYYALLQMPFYEFLAIAGSLLAIVITVFKKRSTPDASADHKDIENKELPDSSEKPNIKNNLSIITLLLFLGIASLIAFTVAGEKMPWLTLQIAVPFLLLAGKGLGEYIDSIAWKEKSAREKTIGILISLLIVIDFFSILISLLGNTPPFQGKTQEQLQQTYSFLFRGIVLIGLISLHRFCLKDWPKTLKSKVFIIALFILLGGITGQSALRASFVNDDYPTEYLVYAHGAPGPKEILEQVEKISRRLTGGLNLQVAYDNDSLYPFWWYFRHYPNRIAYLENPTRSLADVPIILAGQANYDSVEPITRKDYYTFEYFRLWWPNQDYFNLTLDRITGALKSANMRQALFNIWYSRDYSLYAELNKNSFLDVSTWSPSQKMRMYIRKDIAEQMWEFVSEDTLTQNPAGDVLAAITTTISPTQFIGGDETLNEPRGIDIAPDGSIYVADSKNNQIKHFSTSGILLDAWGSFGSIADTNAPGGTFYEPWDVAVSPDGTIYVADTWNHRIQKFTADGQFVSTWGYFAQDNTPLGYWGPRGITVDADGNVYFTDTGNKRIVVFDKNDNFVAQFGTGGSNFGQYDEPVGIALDENNNLYIADTWNTRVQVIVPDLELNTSTPLMSWDVEGWYGESTNNKPFIAVNAERNVFVTDPEGSLILEYSPSGELLHAWDIRGLLDDTITMPVDIEFADDGTMWVSDAASNMVYGYDIGENAVVEQVETVEVTPTLDLTLEKESQLTLMQAKTHQDFINAAYDAAEELGISPWVLLRAAGWGNFTDERGALYSGEHILDIKTLSEVQKETLLKYLGIMSFGE